MNVLVVLDVHDDGVDGYIELIVWLNISAWLRHSDISHTNHLHGNECDAKCAASCFTTL